MSRSVCSSASRAASSSSSLIRPLSGSRSFASLQPRRPINHSTSLSTSTSARSRSRSRSAIPFPSHRCPTTTPTPTPSSNPQIQKRSFQNILAPAEGSEGPDAPLAINKLTPRGWVLSDNLLVPGGMVVHSGRAILWDVDPPLSSPPPGVGAAGAGVKGLEAMWGGWSEERFRVLEVLVPRPEILLFGTGQRALPAPKAIRDYISGLGIQLDVMDSRNAASTYNLLAEEGRTVAAALCPLTPIDPRTGGPR